MRGYGFEIEDYELFRILAIVSVPLRGYGFEMTPNKQIQETRQQFPSPYGDMVLKYCGKIAVSSIVRVVSVPLRGYGFEIFFEKIVKGADFGTVSVPLRGYGFEITVRSSYRHIFYTVSVPLRGYGFEIHH